MSIQNLEPQQKALEINLDSSIYGSFAEIGAGQEVAQYFFKAGASSGTIAKTISAYDKLVSDAIYGIEKSGRYICESRLYKMLEHEFDLLIDRLSQERSEGLLFAFADTIETLNYHKTNFGNGWMGIRFQLHPQEAYNEIVFHIELLDNDTALQQQAVGVLGVNLIYACFNYYQDYKAILSSLTEGIDDRVKVDMCRIKGPQFEGLDNRLVTLELVKQGLSNVAMFDEHGCPVHPCEFLYKKNLLVVRGSFRPATHRTLDRIHAAANQFNQEKDLSPRGTETISEITLSDLCIDIGTVIEQDFLDRVALLQFLGQKVMITNCNEYKGLINYLASYKIAKLGIVIGAGGLLKIVNSKYNRNKDGRLITSYGEIFTRNVKIYVYPSVDKQKGGVLTCQNIPIPEGVKYLYKHIFDNQHVVDIVGYNPDVIHIYAIIMLRMIEDGEPGWEKFVRDDVADFIKRKNLFGYTTKEDWTSKKS